MAQNISLWGATYSNVPAVDLPKSTSGTARFTDTSPTTAIKSDVASGKIFFLADGTQETGTNSGGGGGSVQMDTKTATASSYPSQLQFTGMKGEPKMFALHSTSSISSSGNTTYYYIINMVMTGDGTAHGNCFRIGSTRQVTNVTSGYTWTYSGTTLTLKSSASSRSNSPGAFNNSYELVYIY